ncbi:MAG: NAD(+)/NADH kinase [Candidatus Ancaeobacter aquaticus]|nr:NAD(+)/NADH kinase [Candidatus Ancaeobacter aquaticus]
MKQFGLIAHKTKKHSIDVAEDIMCFCDQHGVKLKAESWIAQKLKRPEIGTSFDAIIKKTDIVLVLGGDGTILSTAKKMKGIKTPLLGINLGGLGFLTAIRYQDVKESLLGILQGKINIEKRVMLKASVIRKGQPVEVFHAANDVVVTNSALARMINLEVSIDSEYLTNYTSDGLIVATPTGSTAHSLSAGGSIVCPDIPSILVTPICPHSLRTRPLIISENKIIYIDICSQYDSIFLTIDGQVGAQLEYHDNVMIERSKQCLHLAYFTDNTYFDILREKLKWGGYSKCKSTI